MKVKTEEFFRIMLEFLPSTSSKYRDTIDYYGEVLEITIIEEVFMPELIKLLSENKNINLLESIFNYFEEVSNYEDKHLLNIFSVGVLEVLGNEKAILKTAQNYMGDKTKHLQIEADRSLGRL